ncbi:proline iminopeptidase-family hydrolase [Chitinophaga sancti]|uniref:proline iminopeptidase-family hydrolase n=1 Tax=Chitinophaga sancti TaxID=1004 RepID=UPI002A7492D9|nr:proline iminopeptidase-family hydrolase [Chitinophaga sancti]WPQ61299.1 proline iminopeptidase-family hydrolase [Chitinophaga sancti]
MTRTLLVFAAMSFFACKQPATNPALTSSTEDTTEIKTGGNKLIEVDGKYHVWTKKVGDGKIKVLLLHGGPGFSHDYMECFENFLPKEGMEIYYYDQLGCGNSDQPSDTTLWTVSNYVEELEQVRKGLHLDSFYIVGHSWGGMLAMEYLHKYQSHVKGAVLSNMTAGMIDYTTYTKQLKAQFFSARDLAVYDSLDKLKKYDSPEYNDLLMNKLYTQAICRLPVESWPEPLLRAFKKANHTIYIQMQGVDEFHVTGNFKNWEFWDKLPDIKTPVLVLGGMHDEMSPEGMKREAQLLPNSRLYLCPNGSHMSMYDDQQRYFTNLVGFLKDVDGGKFVADKK